MDLFQQLDQINKSIKESYCEHKYLSPLHTAKVQGFEYPVTCDDCGKILECKHDEIDVDDNNDYYCTLCGTYELPTPDYDAWAEAERYGE